MKKAHWIIASRPWPSAKTVEIYAICNVDKSKQRHFRHEINLYDIEALIKARNEIKHSINLIGSDTILDLTKTLEKRWTDHNTMRENESDFRDFLKNG